MICFIENGIPQVLENLSRNAIIKIHLHNKVKLDKNQVKETTTL
jgi:hypothetical protein